MICRTSHQFALGALAVILVSLTTGAHAQQPARVSVDPVIEQPFTQTIPILGRLLAKRSGTVATRISGAVSQLLVEVGDVVNAGQVIAYIDDEALQLKQQQAQARMQEEESKLKTARAQLTLATQEVKRLAGLTNSAAISKAAYDDARQQQKIAIARVNEAEAGISSSRSQLAIAELELKHVKITAPFAGTVTRKLTETGNYLQPGQAVYALISDRDLELEADIPANLVAGLNNAREVSIFLENGSAHKAKLRAIIPEENPRTRTRAARFTLSLGAEAGLLASEQSATVHIPAAAVRDILSVHKDAVIRRGDANIVYVVVDGQAELRPIELGRAVGDRLEIDTGLALGEQVVVRGNERLFPGQPVSIAGDQ